MLENKYLHTIVEVNKQNKYNHLITNCIKKGDKVALTLKNGKNKQQYIEGICIKMKNHIHNPAITIKYKLSGTLIEQRIPLTLTDVQKIERL